MSCSCGGRSGGGDVAGRISDAAMTLVLWGERARVRRYADRRGVVRWLGVEWYGVPYPLRIVLRILWRIPPRRLPGCGCIKPLKDLLTRRYE